MNVFGYYFRPRELVCCRVLADGRLKEFASARSDDWGLLAVDPHGRWLCVAPEFSAAVRQPGFSGEAVA